MAEDYRVITQHIIGEGSFEEFEDKVKEAMRDKWEPLGGIGLNENMIVQAMKRPYFHRQLASS